MSYKNIINQEKRLQQSFDDMLGEEQPTPKRMDESLNSFGVIQPSVNALPADHSQELAEITASIRSMAKQLEEKQIAPLVDNSHLTIHDVHKMFSVNRFGKHKQEGPRNFYDHVESISTRDIFNAQLQVNNKRNILSIGDIRDELKQLDQDNEAKRVVGTITDLNKVAYDIMKKTHERETKQHPGDPELATKHSLERSYFKYRISLDEPKPTFDETKANQAKEKEKVLQTTSTYLENNPEFRELMRIEKSLLEDSDKVSNWKKGLRDFHGTSIQTEKDQFEAKQQMVSMQRRNLRIVSSEDKPTLIQHIKTEQAVFEYKSQEFQYNQDPTSGNLDRLNVAMKTMFATANEYEKHLQKKDMKKQSKGSLDLENQEQKPRTLQQVKDEYEEAQKHYGSIVARGNITAMTEAFSNMKHLEGEFLTLQSKHQFPLTAEQQDIVQGLMQNLPKKKVMDNIQKMQSTHRQK